MMRISLPRAFAAALFLALALVAGGASAQDAPDALVKRVSQDVLQAVKADPQIQAGSQTRIREVIEAKLLPHFDFKRMTALAMGRNWRSASPEQQEKLTGEFRTLLVRTYSGAMSQYRNETIDYKPLRANPSDTEVVVRTAVNKQGGGQPVQMDYSMEKTPDGWKAYDVVVGGVSLVTNYRDEFNGTVQSSGIDGLLQKLADKNRNGPAK